eukprot:CAMPEP_0206425978 /NCGR_PEP_ID=MMETSP0324_2-20121206/4104_1 /ASSEMBLY_ACC=CAM_ASM_000836 /TAXON_ID=2866 /ORGANISM="Crypthecodinium cohnii, Strain Seligo" /LENGTH=514 /DNA_ID=CAMNT_0053890845 /DNA_START=183 /DNA_END=1727 /DNA_ORIENTATION=-
MDEALSSIPWGRFQWLLFCTCGMGYAAECIELLLLSFAIPMLKEEWGLDNTTAAYASLLSNFGIMIGAAGWGILADCIGRRAVFLGSVLMTFAGGLACAFVPNFLLFVAARFFVGAGIGGNLAVDFTLFMEFVPLQIRQQVMMMLTMWGVFGCGMIAIAARLLLPSLGWRWYIGVLSLPSLLLLLLRIGMPESPALMYETGDVQGALEALRDIARRNGTELPRDLVLRPPPGRANAPLALGAGGESSDDSSESQSQTTSTKSCSNSSNGATEDSRHQHARRDANPCLDDQERSSVDQMGPRNTLRAKALRLLVPLSSELRGATLKLGIIWFMMSFSYGGFTLWLPELLKHKGIEGAGVYTMYGIMIAAEVPGLCLTTFLVWQGVEKRYVLSGSICGCLISMLAATLVHRQALVPVVLACIYFFVVSAWATLYVLTPEAYPATCRATASGMLRIISSTGSMLTAPIGASLLKEGVMAPLYTYSACFLLGTLVAPLLPDVTNVRGALLQNRGSSQV